METVINSLTIAAILLRDIIDARYSKKKILFVIMINYNGFF